MPGRQEQKRKQYLISAIVLIVIGVATLTLNSQGILPGQWSAIIWVRWILVSSAFLLIALGIAMWIWNSLHAMHGNLIISSSLRQVIIPIGVSLIILGTAISIGSNLGVLKGNSTTIPPILLNSLGWVMALISLPLPTSTSATDISQTENVVNGASSSQFSFLPLLHADTPYKNIRAVPPPIDPKVTQRYEKTVMDVYTKLTESTITAITLTGFSDISTSTLASLIYQEARQRREAGERPFEVEELWLSGSICK